MNSRLRAARCTARQRNFRVGSKTTLAGDLCSYDGCDDGRFAIPLSKIERLEVMEIDGDGAIAELWTINGEPLTVRLPADAFMHANSTLGRIRVRLKNIEKLELR